MGAVTGATVATDAGELATSGEVLEEPPEVAATIAALASRPEPAELATAAGALEGDGSPKGWIGITADGASAAAGALGALGAGDGLRLGENDGSKGTSGATDAAMGAARATGVPGVPGEGDELTPAPPLGVKAGSDGEDATTAAATGATRTGAGT